MLFKDVTTELTESLLKSLKKNALLCPNCRKGRLSRNSTIEHYCEVAVVKFASSFIGGAVPAPDYRYKCSRCKSVFLLVDGKFVPIIKQGGGN